MVGYLISDGFQRIWKEGLGLIEVLSAHVPEEYDEYIVSGQAVS
jgi:hypothetical protein